MAVVVIADQVRIPKSVVDLASFRRWIDADDFPEEGRIDYLAGELWVDMSWEQVFTHNQVKSEFNMVLGRLVKKGRLGRYFPDGLRLSNLDADLSVQPDGTFIAQSSFRERVRLIEGAQWGHIEVEGTPDMVLEIISDSSVKKDTIRLPQLYWEAGIPEFWLVDVRRDRLSFNILCRAAKGYVAVRKKAGWVPSAVFGSSFRLTRTTDELGHPEYTLAVRSG
jgi:Uma2 family endonuclease